MIARSLSELFPEALGVQVKVALLPCVGVSSDREGAKQNRRVEFLAGRKCAAKALAELGAVEHEVGVHADRSPAWPPGYVGSISHSQGVCCAAVAEASRAPTIGLDIECMLELEDELSALVGSRGDDASRLRIHGWSERAISMILFCVKEAAYKAYYPMGGRILEFSDIAVQLMSEQPGRGSFSISPRVSSDLPRPEVLRALRGRWLQEADYTAAAAYLWPTSELN